MVYAGTRGAISEAPHGFNYPLILVFTGIELVMPPVFGSWEDGRIEVLARPWGSKLWLGIYVQIDLTLAAGKPKKGAGKGHGQQQG